MLFNIITKEIERLDLTNNFSTLTVVSKNKAAISHQNLSINILNSTFHIAFLRTEGFQRTLHKEMTDLPENGTCICVLKNDLV